MFSIWSSRESIQGFEHLLDPSVNEANDTKMEANSKQLSSLEQTITTSNHLKPSMWKYFGFYIVDGKTTFRDCDIWNSFKLNFFQKVTPLCNSERENSQTSSVPLHQISPYPQVNIIIYICKHLNWYLCDPVNLWPLTYRHFLLLQQR